MVHEVCHYNRCESQITDNLYLVCVTGNSPDLYLTQGGGVDFLHHMFWSFCVQQVQFSIVRSIDIGGISDLLSPLMLIQITRSSI
jgi:hypothetical protein